ncbi:MAG: hypothetical protein LQ347_002709 [Umbilicaria vellea]|nr:MAG: hypothetical protein LQ347_002709 [Umbilicaria vellea]
MPPKRRPSSTPGAENPSLTKAPKTDGSPADFSHNVKKKLSSSTRTGQACDRCKTTDRITGRATTRGHVEELEQRSRDYLARIRELEERLVSMGADVKPMVSYPDIATAPLVQWNQAQENGGLQTWEDNGASGSVLPYTSEPSSSRTSESNFIRLPEFRKGLHGDNYLGVSSGNSFLSSIRGTSLNVLGMEINIADFASTDLDGPVQPSLQQEPLYNKSYQSFVMSAFGVNPRLEKVALPPKTEGLTYAQWYFRALSPYLPTMHKPTFMALLARMYDDPSFEPSAAETVMVHMVFAIMFFQYAARNWENAGQQLDLNVRSNLHYHYSLGHLSQLMTSHTLEDVQAMTMISTHVRNFPKPGPCCMIVGMTFNLAIELGLHRSAKRWATTTPKKNVLEIEMRKRIFWAILAIHVTISGKLGRPMAIRSEDIDVEIPEAVDDDLLHETGIDISRPGKCGFLVGIEACKLTAIFLDLFNSIYAVKRSPHTYVETVRRLETRIRQWTEQWPAELTQESVTIDQEGRVFALYLGMWSLEFRLLLRHPSLCLTTSPDFNNENLGVSMEASRAMLHNVKQLQKYKSLDTTWYNAALYVLAVSTTLFGQWSRKEQINSSDLATLRADMGAWLNILGEVGGLLGSGKRLQDAVRVTVDNTLGLLASLVASKTASSALSTANQTASPGGSPIQGNQLNQDYGNPNSYSSYPDPSTSANGHLADNLRNNNYMAPDDPSMTGHASHPYPNAPQYSYPEPNATTLSSYHTGPTPFDSTPYPAVAAEALSSAQHPQTTPQQAAAVAANAFLYSNAPQHQSPAYASGGSHQWRQWAGTMAGIQVEPQEYLNSASALMQLGGRNDQNAGANGAPVADMTGAQLAAAAADANAMSGGAGQPWPLMIFDIGQGGS